MPTQAGQVSTTGVSCAPDGSCLAIGQAQGPGYAFAVGKYHGHWSAVTVIGTPGADPALNGVTCISDGNCVAVGSETATSTIPVIATESRNMWHVVKVVPPAGPLVHEFPDELSSVACSQPGECVAVGSYVAAETQSSTATQPMTVAESHGKWQHAQTIPAPADAGAIRLPAGPGVQSGGTLEGAGLVSVSCMLRGPCMAVGPYFTSTGTFSGLAVSGADGRWGGPRELPPLAVIGCTAGYCVSLAQPMVRLTYPSGRYGPAIAFTYTHGQWRQGERIMPPANARTAHEDALGLVGLTCFPDGGCTAGGSYVDRSGHQHLMVATRP